jgi:hypothetical protein
MDLNQNFNSDRDDYEYPPWIGHRLINGSLPWNQAEYLSFERFHQGYTLHDSSWVGIFHGGFTQTVTLTIAWDTVWLPEPMKQTVSGETFLFIQLSQVTEMSTVKSDIEFNCILGCEDEAIDGVRLLSIEIIGGTVDITYQGVPAFLAMADDGKILTLFTTEELSSQSTNS